MTVGVKKPFALSINDTSGGCNSIEHPTKFNTNQVHEDSIGYMLKKSGIVKYPGSQGLSSSNTLTDYLRGLFTHKQFTGTENLYTVSGGVLNLVSLVDGSLTSKYTLGTAGKEVWACDAYGKKWVCNGNSVVKIEGTTAYQVGITAPSGASAAASAGSGLPDGVYGVYVTYSRSGLYSQGQDLGNVTLGTGNNRITVTFPNSSDPQVNNKIVWIKSPGEDIHYYFQATGNNTTTSIVVSSASGKDIETIYEVDAADNGKPPAITFIYAFNSRLWGILDNYIYYSDQGEFSDIDVEKWRAVNFRRTQYKITGIFSVGLNLYFNTENGILILQNGDINEPLYLIETRWYFKEMRTVAAWNNGVIGVTDNGIRLFDGSQFSTFDYSYPIRSKLHTLYSSPSDLKPCGYIQRRSNRDEYHLMWSDQISSVTTNNVHAVLNLSSVIWQDSNAYQLAWEFQPVSGNYVAITSGNTVYIGQSHETASKIYKEDLSTTKNNNCYDSSGTLITSNSDTKSKLRTREIYFDISTIIWIEKFYLYAQNDYPFSIQIYSGNDINKFSKVYEIPASGGAISKYDSAVYDESVYPSESAQTSKSKLSTDFRCRNFYVVITQEEDDINFKLLELAIIGKTEANNYV
jgi:hypothetical protein